MLLWLIIWFILGGWGSGLGRDPEDYWPKWCWKCRIIIGGIGAIIINMIVEKAITDGGFVAMAIVSLAAGYTISRLAGGIFGAGTARSD